MAITRLGGANAITGTIPTSVAPGQGKVLQVKSSKSNTEVTFTTSGTEVFALEVSITPASTSNKILVSMHTNGVDSGGGGRAVSVLRRGTVSGDTSGTEIGSFNLANTDTNASGKIGGSLMVLDTPSSTSTLYYKINMYNQDDGNQSHLSQYGEDDYSITVMEIAG